MNTYGVELRGGDLGWEGEKGIVVGDKELSGVGGGHIKKVPVNNLMARI